MKLTGGEETKEAAHEAGDRTFVVHFVVCLRLLLLLFYRCGSVVLSVTKWYYFLKTFKKLEVWHGNRESMNIATADTHGGVSLSQYFDRNVEIGVLPTMVEC